MRRHFTQVLIGLILLFASVGIAEAQCPTSGTITTDCTTTGDLNLTGSTLTVNPGVTVTVTGTLRVRGGSTLNGTGASFNLGNLADAYGTLNTINGGTYTVSGTFAAAGGGAFTLSGATVNAAGATSFAGSDIIISNSSISTTNLDMNLGTMTISNSDFTTTGYMDFEEATITNSVFDIGGELIINSGASTADNSTISTGAGYAVATGVSGLTMNGGGTLTLTGDTQMDVTGDVTNNEWYIDDSDVTISGNFDNAGAEVLVVQNNGTISVGGDFTNTGSGNVTATTDGVITVEGDYDNSGGGNTDVTDGALIVNGTYTGGNPGGGGGCAPGAGACCGPSCSTLPIALLSYRIRSTEEGIFHQWTTLSEQNNAYFTLALSTDGREFSTLAEIEGSGTTYTPRTYSFEEAARAKGTYYYRLSQTDYDGTTEVVSTKVLQVQTDRVPRLYVSQTLLSAEEDVLLEQIPENPGILVVYLVDVAGRRQAVPIATGPEVILQLSQLRLASGLYLLVGQADDHVLQQKIVIR